MAKRRRKTGGPARTQIRRNRLATRGGAIAPHGEDLDPLVTFDRVWARIHEQGGRLFPQGIAEANINLTREPSGRTSINIQIRARGEAESTPLDALSGAPGLAAPSIAPPTAIDLTKPLSEKVSALWEILEVVVSDLDGSAPAARKRIVKTFLLHLAGHESQLRTRRQDAGGPARSLFQCEAHRAKDAGAHVQTLGLIGKLAAASGNSAADLAAGITALPVFDARNPARSASFPAGNLIEARLLDNDLFAAYLARIDFRRFTALIPATNEDQAEYWLKFWKGTAPDPTAAKKQFLDNCARVDPHIPAS